jgi:hypothetical protein
MVSKCGMEGDLLDTTHTFNKTMTYSKAKYQQHKSFTARFEVTLWSLCKIIYFVLYITQHFCISTDYLSSGANIACKYA